MGVLGLCEGGGIIQRTELGANIATESEREILGKRDTERGNPKFCVKTLVKCVAEP